ncbi:hypothetical protein [Lutibacter sp.]|uniref:hypothetical protein n=1 Tax=Lutibacter sp. TaxID=1925666 RepID=UPI003564FF1A
MKLLMITAIEVFEKDIKFLLKKAAITHFSYSDVKGYRDLTQESVGDNWFASEMNESQSIIFYAFVPKEKADDLFNSVAEFNKQQRTLSKVHIVVLNIEKSN